MNTAMSRGSRKAMRDLLQAVAAALAGGGAVALEALATDSVDPTLGVILAFVLKIVFTFIQNWAETRGSIGVLLPTPGLVAGATGAAPVVAGTVDAVAEKVGDTIGEVTGTVTSTAGELLGEVVDVDHEEG